MSDFEILQGASTESHEQLAQMQGASAGGTNARIGNHDFLMVFGHPRQVEIMLPNGGYRRRVEVTGSATRTQFTSAPASKVTLTRTDITPAGIYTVESVGTHEPLVYTFVLVRAGGE